MVPSPFVDCAENMARCANQEEDERTSNVSFSYSTRFAPVSANGWKKMTGSSLQIYSLHVAPQEMRRPLWASECSG